MAEARECIAEAAGLRGSPEEVQEIHKVAVLGRTDAAAQHLGNHLVEDKRVRKTFCGNPDQLSNDIGSFKPVTWGYGMGCRRDEE